jgi:probable phosphoglycerate mutase
MSSTTRLILIRHGESVANLEGRFTENSEEPLTELGIEQARSTAAVLAQRFAPVSLYASPFRRAFDTALEIGRVFGLDPLVEAELREQDFGVYRGRPYADFYGQYPAGSVERWDHLPEGGERLREVAVRCHAVLERVARRHRGEQVLVVCHGGVMAAVRGQVGDDFERPPVSTPNAWGYVLHADEAGFAGPFELDEYEGP